MQGDVQSLSKYQTPSRIAISRPKPVLQSKYNLGTPQIQSRREITSVGSSGITQVQQPVSSPAPGNISIEKLRQSMGHGGYTKNELKQFLDAYGVRAKSSDTKGVMVNKLLSQLGY